MIGEGDLVLQQPFAVLFHEAQLLVGVLDGADGHQRGIVSQLALDAQVRHDLRNGIVALALVADGLVLIGEVHREGEDGEALGLERDVVGAALEVHVGLAVAEDFNGLDVARGDDGLGGGIHVRALQDPVLQRQMHHVDVARVLRADLRDLVLAEGDLHGHGVRLGLDFIGPAGLFAGLGIEFIHDEGKVVEQGVDFVVFRCRVVVQHLHIGVVTAALGDGRHDEAGLVRHGAAVRQHDLGNDAVILEAIETFSGIGIENHDQLRVRGERRGHVSGGVGPGAVFLAVGEGIQHSVAHARLYIDVAPGIDRRGVREVVIGARQVHIAVAGHQREAVQAVVAGRVGHLHIGIVRLDGDGHLGGKGFLVLDRRDDRLICTGLASGPFEALAGVAGGHFDIVLINSEIHPLGAGGIKSEIYFFVRENRVGIGGEIRERELNRFRLFGRLDDGLIDGRLSRGRAGLGVRLLGGRRLAGFLFGILLGGFLLARFRLRFAFRLLRTLITDHCRVFGLIFDVGLFLILQTVVCFALFLGFARIIAIFRLFGLLLVIVRGLLGGIVLILGLLLPV